MAIIWASGTQYHHSNVISWKTAVTGQQETRSNNQGSSGFSAVSGLNSISHSIRTSGNLVICRFSCCWGGNANTDEARVLFTYDNNDGHGGAVGHASQASSSQTRNNSVHAVGAFAPNDLNSHTYRAEWISAEGGASQVINKTIDPNFWTQCLFEVIEVDSDSASASGNQGNSYAAP
mgnify:FL=1